MAGEKFLRIKNTSRGYLFLDLGVENDNKVIEMKPDATAAISETAWNYLVNQCPNLFHNGDVEMVSAPKDAEIEKVETENVYSDKDIADLVEKNLTQFKKSIAKIDSLSVIKDIGLKEPYVGDTILITSERIHEAIYMSQAILDGLQRTDAMCGYLNNKYALSKNTKPLQCICKSDSGKTIKYEIEIAGKKFSQLPPALQRIIRNYDISMYEYSGFTDDELDDIIYNINKYYIRFDSIIRCR